jgi:hypothetical protein
MDFTFCIFELPICSLYLSTLLVNLNGRKFINNIQASWSILAEHFVSVLTHTSFDTTRQAWTSLIWAESDTPPSLQGLHISCSQSLLGQSIYHTLLVIFLSYFFLFITDSCSARNPGRLRNSLWRPPMIRMQTSPKISYKFVRHWPLSNLPTVISASKLPEICKCSKNDPPNVEISGCITPNFGRCLAVELVQPGHGSCPVSIWT